MRAWWASRTSSHSLHPYGYEPPDSGWPPSLVPVALRPKSFAGAPIWRSWTRTNFSFRPQLVGGLYDSMSTNIRVRDERRGQLARKEEA